MRKAEDKLTLVEWEIMQVIWSQDNAVSVRDVLQQAYPNGEKAYTTVQTMMNILVRKGILQSRKIGLVNFYSPLKSREEILEREMKHLAERAFSGSLPALANYLVDAQDLDLADIEKIKSLLEEKEAKLRSESS
ncbi:BlaI/MecI/CopY family transcriptional regulator [candidate division KSB1 bacterium]|nr:BlaI/MecI/CopY family transcriptional regulator [candidate division KSB1 bacterium]